MPRSVAAHCGLPHTVGCRTLWAAAHCGLPHTVGALFCLLFLYDFSGNPRLRLRWMLDNYIRA